MRKIIAKLLYFLLYFKVRKELCRNDSLLAIYGHDQKGKPLEDLLVWMLGKGYKFVTPSEVNSYVKEGINKYEGAKLAWLSFDDGWLSNYTEVLPVLIKHNVPATIFVATKGVEDGYYWTDKALQNRHSKLYKMVDELWEMPNVKRKEIIEKLPAYQGDRHTMNVVELKEMADSGLITWGNHTYDHVMSDNCTTEELMDEIKKCSVQMEEFVGDNCNFIYSYPNGNYDLRSMKVIQHLGFQMAVTTEIGRVFPYTDSFAIKRNEIKNVCLEENILQALGLWTPFFNELKRMLGIKNKK